MTVGPQVLRSQSTCRWPSRRASRSASPAARSRPSRLCPDRGEEASQSPGCLPATAPRALGVGASLMGLLSESHCTGQQPSTQETPLPGRRQCPSLPPCPGLPLKAGRGWSPLGEGELGPPPHLPLLANPSGITSECPSHQALPAPRWVTP